MNNKTKSVLERIVKLATNVHNLHGRYELGKEGYEELRGLVKEAMECLRPKEIVCHSVAPLPPWRREYFGTWIEYDGRGVEPMWKGYRQADVLVAATKRSNVSARFYTFDGDELLAYGHHSDLNDNDAQWVPWLREEGLRRPDEPDYKKLG